MQYPDALVEPELIVELHRLLDVLRIQSDDKILLAGRTDASGNNDFAVARFTASGALDTTTFGTGGKLIESFGGVDEANAIVVQSDGKIVVGGRSDGSGNYDFALARYSSGGALDTATFATNGKVVQDFGASSSDLLYDLLVQSDGNIVAGGSTGSDFGLMRFSSAGALDSTFDGDGKVITNFGGTDADFSIALQSDGKIVAAGRTIVGGASNFAVGRYYGGPGLEERLYAQQDANFNVTAVTTAGGHVMERYVYDPYGSVTYLTVNWTTRSSSNYNWVYLHQGGRFDSTAGLYHFRNRDYSPTIGRWTRQDPLGYINGANPYQYIVSRPVSGVDPTGLFVNPSMIGSIDDMDYQFFDWFEEYVNDWLDWLTPQDIYASTFAGLNAYEQLGLLSMAFDPGGADDGTNMWIYTCKCGWIDLGHFTKAAAYSQYMMRPFNEVGNPVLSGVAAAIISRLVYLGSYTIEVQQALMKLLGDKTGWGSSAFTYEDLPSNWQGAQFGAYLPRFGNVMDALKQYLRDCGAVDPNKPGVRALLERDAASLQQSVEAAGTGFGGAPGFNYGSRPMKTPSHDKLCCNGDAKR
jgi:RHS repeat-associated protein/uncharacterized delta-60 repeat protein